MTYHHTTTNQADCTLNTILDIIVEGVWDWNGITGEVIRSPGWYRMLGFEIDVFKKDVFTWENLIHPDDYPKVMAHFEEYINGSIEQYEIEYRCKKADGDYLWIIDRAKIVSYTDDGHVARMIGAHHNIHQQKIAQISLEQQNQLLQKGNLSLEQLLHTKVEELEQANHELHKKVALIESISNTDPLTKVANRKHFERLLRKEIQRAERYKNPLSLAIFDIDHFKRVNDDFGHKTGDKLICAISKLVSDNIRDTDVLARWGGDEFVIIFPELSPKQASLTCEKLRGLIKKCTFHEELTITSSFGVAAYQAGESLDELFQRVDSLLFKSKETGRDSVHSTG